MYVSDVSEARQGRTYFTEVKIDSTNLVWLKRRLYPFLTAFQSFRGGKVTTSGRFDKTWWLNQSPTYPFLIERFRRMLPIRALYNEGPPFSLGIGPGENQNFQILWDRMG